MTVNQIKKEISKKLKGKNYNQKFEMLINIKVTIKECESYGILTEEESKILLIYVTNLCEDLYYMS